MKKSCKIIQSSIITVLLLALTWLWIFVLQATLPLWLIVLLALVFLGGMLYLLYLQKFFVIILILAIIGVYNAIDLSIYAYQYWDSTNAAMLQALPCDINATLSCSGILQNPRAIIFSIGAFKVAFPMIALFVYPVLALLALSGWIRKSTTEAKWLTGLAVGGILFNGYVISQEIIVGVFCPLCAMCTLIIITIFFLSIFIWKGEKKTTTPTKV